MPPLTTENNGPVPKQYGWGIIGTGNIAKKFADDLQYVTGARKIGVYSRNGSTGSAFASQFNFEKTYDDLSSFLANTELDIVYIATPHIAHLEQALAAIQCGKAVLIEKPITMTAQEALMIAAASADKKIFAMEAMWSRFLPTVQRAKAIIDSGQLGEITRAEACLIYHRAYDEKDRLYNPELGGGVLHDLGVYPISVTAYLLGTPSIKSSQWYRAPNGVNNHANLELTCGTTPVHIETGFSHDGENSLNIYGTKGTLRINRHFLRSDSITVWDTPKSSIPQTSASLKNRIANRLGLFGGRTEHYPIIGNGLHYQANAVQAALGQKLKSHPVMPVEDSAMVLAIIEEVLALPPATRK